MPAESALCTPPQRPVWAYCESLSRPHGSGEVALPRTCRRDHWKRQHAHRCVWLTSTCGQWGG
eukprot:11528113-Heterocapsa_arctica.AAC.1